MYVFSATLLQMKLVFESRSSVGLYRWVCTLLISWFRKENPTLYVIKVSIKEEVNRVTYKYITYVIKYSRQRRFSNSFVKWVGSISVVFSDRNWTLLKNTEKLISITFPCPLLFFLTPSSSHGERMTAAACSETASLIVPRHCFQWGRPVLIPVWTEKQFGLSTAKRKTLWTGYV